LAKVPTLQELSKDPDLNSRKKPIIEPIDSAKTEAQHWSCRGVITLKNLRSLINEHGQSGGNKLFAKALKKYLDKWGLVCDGASKQFSNFPYVRTWEEEAVTIMAVAGGRTAAERYYIERIFSDDVEQGLCKWDNNDQIDEIWRHRKFFMALAMSDPAVAFSLSKGLTIHNAVY